MGRRRRKGGLAGDAQRRALSAPAPERSDLQKTRLSAEYRERLAFAGFAFQTFCRHQGQSVGVLAANARALCEMLIRFIDDVHNTRKPLWVGTHAILAMQTWDRTLKGQLDSAWDSAQAWKLEKPVRSRVPMNVSILQAVAYAAVMHAARLDARNSVC